MFLNSVSLFIIPLVLLISICHPVTGKHCPGKCVQNTTACTAKGGKVVGYCTNELACCDSIYTGTCGAVKSGHHSAIFQSPKYPEYNSGDLNCEFQLDLAKQKYDAIVLEFEDVYMEGNGFTAHSPCETDMIFIKGFKHWHPPPRCGNLTGYVALIDRTKNTSGMKTLKLVALMSGFQYKWKIKIRLIRLNTPKKVEHVESTTEEIIHEMAKLGESRKMSLQSRTGESAKSSRELPLIEPLIVNGHDADITEVPWQVSLRQYYPDYILKRVKENNTSKYNRAREGCELEGQHFCGGSIISDRFVLSAAHCFYSRSKLFGWKKLDTVKVYLGETDLCEDDAVKYDRKPQNHSIEKIIFHYAYDDINGLLNDVVILKLKDKIKFNDYIKPIALSKRNKIYTGMTAKASGWGLTNLTAKHTSIPLLLQSAEGFVVENKTYCDDFLLKSWAAPKRMVEAYPKYRDGFNNVLCTSSKNDTISQLVGQGDSGGSLIYLDDSHDPPIPIQIGIVSFGLNGLESVNEHDNIYVDFFQDVGFYRNWIDLAMSV